MEKESQVNKSREEKLREKGHQIEKVRLSEDESRQCDSCMDKDKHFGFHEEGWFIEGEFYCAKHKEGALDVLEEIDREAEGRRLERERIVEERRKRSGLK